jgi:hypothetical protein
LLTARRGADEEAAAAVVVEDAIGKKEANVTPVLCAWFEARREAG